MERQLHKHEIHELDEFIASILSTCLLKVTTCLDFTFTRTAAPNRSECSVNVMCFKTAPFHGLRFNLNITKQETFLYQFYAYHNE